MFKKSIFIVLFLAAFSLTSCDWVKAHLGMATSKDLQTLKERARQDSLLQAEYLRQEREQQRLIEDAFFDPIMPNDAEMASFYGNSGTSSPSTQGYLASTSQGYTSSTSQGYTSSTSQGYASSAPQSYTPSYTSSTASSNRFHVVVGSFRDFGNADRMARRLADNGYRPEQLLFKNGLMTVSAGSFPSLQDAQAARSQMRSGNPNLFPYDTYIYDMSSRRHVER